jgi:hypothetical protein
MKPKTEKDELVGQTRQQSDPYAALPEHFKITRDGDAAFHGQSSPELIAQGHAQSHRNPNKKSRRATATSDAGKPHTAGMGSDER